MVGLGLTCLDGVLPGKEGSTLAGGGLPRLTSLLGFSLGETGYAVALCVEGPWGRVEAAGSIDL